jgi:ADP-dependent phosphofructokinase/glucokinase
VKESRLHLICWTVTLFDLTEFESTVVHTVEYLVIICRRLRHRTGYVA